MAIYRRNPGGGESNGDYMSSPRPWFRHDGTGSRPAGLQGGTRIQCRIIGTNNAKIKRAFQVDWRETFEWRTI